MYEELIQALQLHGEAGKKIGLNGKIWTLLGDASSALEALTAQLAALQAENVELREENGCLQHNVAAMHATLDQQAKNCETLLAEKDSKIDWLNAELKFWREQAKLEHRGKEMYNGMRLKAKAALSRAETERDAYRILGTVEELSALVEARRDGRVVVLPCRVGENIYYIFPNCGGYLGYFVSEPYKVTEVGTKGFWTSDILDEQPDAMSVFTPWSDFGKTVFLTRAEAEAAISAQKGDSHEANPV